MSGRRPRLIYLHSKLAQMGIHHIQCRRLIAALEQEFEVTLGWALFPEESIQAGMDEVLARQILPESLLFEPLADVLFIEGELSFGQISSEGSEPPVDSKIRRGVLRDYFNRGGITVLDLFSEPGLGNWPNPNLIPFQEYLREARLPPMYLASGMEQILAGNWRNSEHAAWNGVPHAVDKDHVVAPGIFRVDVTPGYLQRVHESLYPAYEGVSQLLLDSPGPVYASTGKPVIAGNPNTTRFLADDLWWDQAPAVFGILNDRGKGCSITITGAPFCDRTLAVGPSDAIKLLTNLLELLLKAQRDRRPYLGLPAVIEKLQEEVEDITDEEAVDEFVQRVHNALERNPSGAQHREDAEELLSAVLRVCWQNLEQDSRQSLIAGESVYRAFRNAGELSFAGPMVECTRAVEIELEAKLFRKFREHLVTVGHLDSALSSSKDRYLGPYVDPSKAGSLMLGPMSRILKSCVAKASADSLLQALVDYITQYCADPVFWFEQLPLELDRVVDYRNGAAHKSAVLIERFRDYRRLALGLDGQSLICRIVNQAPGSGDPGSQDDQC